MVIKRTTNNETIIKQLTELLSNAFEQSLNEVIKPFNFVRSIKESIKEQTVKVDAMTLADFVYFWIHTTCDNVLDEYTKLMLPNDREVLNSVFSEKSFSIGKGSSSFFEQTIIPLAIRVKEYNGSTEESLLAIVKPFLVEEFVVELINQPETTVELLSIIKDYNDYNYQLTKPNKLKPEWSDSL